MLYPYRSSFKDKAMGVVVKLNKIKKYVVSSSLKKTNWKDIVVILTYKPRKATKH